MVIPESSPHLVFFQSRCRVLSIPLKVFIRPSRKHIHSEQPIPQIDSPARYLTSVMPQCYLNINTHWNLCAKTSETYFHIPYALLNLDAIARILYQSSVWPGSGIHQISYLVGKVESLPTDKVSGEVTVEGSRQLTLFPPFWTCLQLGALPPLPCIRKPRRKNVFNFASRAVSNFNNWVVLKKMFVNLKFIGPCIILIVE
jgi:hypothetical protein